MKQLRKRALALLLAAACGLVGCARGEQEIDDTPVDDVRVSDAYFGMAYYQNGPLCPVTDDTAINRLVCEALYEGLFEISDNFTATPVLCNDFQSAEGGTVFTFTLKEGVRFWSGAALTAQDVVASLQTAQFDETSPYHNRMTEVSAIEALSNTQLRITLTSPNAALPRLLDIPVFREGTAGDDFADGTGPFRPEREGSGWVLVNNTDWHEGFLGSVRRITLVSMTRTDAAVSSFQTGDLSLLRTPRITSNPTLVGGSVDNIQTPTADLHYIGVNFANETLANDKVRQALSAALGRQSLCDTPLQGFADPAVLPVNPQPIDDALALSMTTDTETAMRLLSEAELDASAADADDEDEDEGEGGGGLGALSFTLLVNEDNAFKVAAAEQMAAMWAAIGVTVTVEKLPFETFAARVQEGSFDLYYGETLLTPDFDLRPLLSAGGSLNYGGCGSEQTSAAIAAARSGENVSALYTHLLARMPIIPIAFERGQLIMRRGLVDEFTPAPYQAFAGVEDWRTGEATDETDEADVADEPDQTDAAA